MGSGHLAKLDRRHPVDVNDGVERAGQAHHIEVGLRAGRVVEGDDLPEEDLKVGMDMKAVVNELPNGQLNYVFQKP